MNNIANTHILFSESSINVNVKDILNLEKLKLECLQYKENFTESKNSSAVGGWQSADINIDDLDDNYSELVKAFHLIDKFNVDYFAENAKSGIVPLLTNLWININYKNDFTFSHKHPGSILSGCLYVDIPNEDCGNIVFSRNDDFLDYRLNHVFDPKNPDTFSTVSYKPNSGDMVSWPSYIAHMVERSNSEKPRISIAYNISWVKDENL